MQNVISAVFKRESEGYQAITELKKQPITDKYVVSQGVLVRKTLSGIEVLDSFDTGMETANDTAIGGLMGGIVGILGGPIGVLLSGSMGALVGSAVDAADAAGNASILEKVAEQFTAGEVALVILEQDIAANAVVSRISQFEVSIITEDAAEVAEEIKRVEEIQRDMEREAKKRLREEKKEERKKAVSEWRSKMDAEFEALKQKITKKN